MIIVRKKVTHAYLVLRNKIWLRELYWKAGFVRIRERLLSKSKYYNFKQTHADMQISKRLSCNMIMTLCSNLGT